jgi:hypothetical protein
MQRLIVGGYAVALYIQGAQCAAQLSRFARGIVEPDSIAGASFLQTKGK